ncbi:uncharacterized protein [Temnothorax nylanderi]|uniref:uncharacterized protein n=1 Tax=Temnothorax nylanderi TaxID=102681 RepID=UPI003A845331
MYKEEEEDMRGNDIVEVEGQEEGHVGEVIRNDRGSEETWKVAFWNVAGISNKDKNFWEGIKEWDVIVMMETWTDEKGWEKVKEKLPREYRWRVQKATRRNRKGRACGGMLLGIRKSIEEIKEGRETEIEGKIEGKIRIGEEIWRIIGIYVNNDIDKKLEGLKEWTEEGEKGVRTIIGGDFNARTGEEGGWEEEIERRDEDRGRRSKDKKINKEGRKLLEFIEERGWMILNGGTKGDEEGEYTYTGGRGETVIDYVIGEEEVREKVVRLEIGERIDSDHHPIILWVRGSPKRKQKRRGAERIRRRGIWNEEGRTQFRERLGAIGGNRDLQEEIEEGTMKIRKVIEENEDKSEKGAIKNRRGWWDEECTEGKRGVRRELRKWRKGKGEVERYRERKKEYRDMCERKKKEEKERMIREIEEARTEGEVWKLIGRARKRRKRVNEEIKQEEWKEYFMELMGGMENRVVKGEGDGNRQEEEEIELEEVRNVIKKLKTGKAIGNDGILNEAWKYGGEKMVNWIWEVCKRVWRGEGWPEQWKEGEIIPLVKKGEGREVKDYRGITIMSSMYKIYTAILAERIREEVEMKKLIPDNQAGFRKGMGTMDQIFALNYLVNRQIGKEKGKMTVFFVDLKAAFDSVDKRVLIKTMRERGVRQGLIDRVEEVLRETKSRVGRGKESGGQFWTAKGLRQGCPLSPILFNLLIADIEEYIKKGGWGGVNLGGEKIYTLMYADDIALLAEEEQDMRAMISRLEGYLDRKGLTLSIEKSKIMRFRKGGGRKKKCDWRWKGKKLEEVKEFKYLGYTLKENGGQEAHIRERRRKAARVMREVWGIGKRMWKKDCKRRIWLYDTLIWTVMGYGAEIWGWKERREVEGIQERYLRWVLGVNWRTPGYMVRDELEREKMRARASKRAWRFERKLGEGRGGEIARKCMEEMKERWKRGRIIGKWEHKRKDYLEGIGVETEEEEELEEEELEKKEKEKDRQERMEKITKSKYNRWYKNIRKEGIPDYLKKGWEEARWSRVARFRLGNEVREGLYWGEEEDRRCRMCGREEETWEHIWEECARWEEWDGEGWQDVVGRLLGEKGEGEKWMKAVEEMRQEERGRRTESAGGRANNLPKED